MVSCGGGGDRGGRRDDSPMTDGNSTAGDSSTCNTQLSLSGDESSLNLVGMFNSEIGHLKKRLDHHISSMVQQSAKSFTGLLSPSNDYGHDEVQEEIGAVGSKQLVAKPRPARAKARKRQVWLTQVPVCPAPASPSGGSSSAKFNLHSARSARSDKTEPKSNLTKHVLTRRRRHQSTIREEENSNDDDDDDGDAAEEERLMEGRPSPENREFFPEQDGEEEDTNTAVSSVHTDSGVLVMDSDGEAYGNSVMLNQKKARTPALRPSVNDNIGDQFRHHLQTNAPEEHQQQEVQQESTQNEPSPNPTAHSTKSFYHKIGPNAPTPNQKKAQTTNNNVLHHHRIVRDAPSEHSDASPRPDAPGREMKVQSPILAQSTSSSTKYSMTRSTTRAKSHAAARSVSPVPCNEPTTSPSASPVPSATESSSLLRKHEAAKRYNEQQQARGRQLQIRTSRSRDMSDISAPSSQRSSSHRKKKQQQPPSEKRGIAVSDVSSGCAAKVSYASSSVRRKMQISQSCRQSQQQQQEHVEDHKLVDPYGDIGMYTGMLQNGLPEGHGKMVYRDGRIYTGTFKLGRWEGHGQVQFTNGDRYMGEFKKDQRHGIGRYEWADDGRVYDGMFRADKRHGQGQYHWPDGSVYMGEFYQGAREGKGTHHYVDGSTYSGSWKNGKQEGWGECLWKDGRCYRGEFSEGSAQGYGREVRADGSVRHDGQWQRGRPIRHTPIKSRKTGTSNSGVDVQKQQQRVVELPIAGPTVSDASSEDLKNESGSSRADRNNKNRVIRG